MMVADDYTGALDTGVKLAQQGVPTAVISVEEANAQALEQAAEVLVVCTETRHQTPGEAYAAVYALVRAARERWPEAALYKKTDSALRGNVGSELAAMMDGAGANDLAYVPALPSQGRVTVRGCQLDHGRPIHESVFARDCYDPVTRAYIPAILAQQTNVRTVCVAKGEESQSRDAHEKTIWVYDSETEQDLRDVARALKEQGREKITAGCAGFAGQLAELLGLGGRKHQRERPQVGWHCVICGSVNPITRHQLEAIEREGVRVMTLPADSILGKSFDAAALAREVLANVPEGGSFAVTTLDAGEVQEKIAYARRQGLGMEEMRELISQRLGLLTRQLCEVDEGLVPMLIGGDTLCGFLRAVGGGTVYPLWEVQPGCVLSQYGPPGHRRWMMTKSGGAGGEDVLLKLRDCGEEAAYG